MKLEECISIDIEKVERYLHDLLTHQMHTVYKYKGVEFPTKERAEKECLLDTIASVLFRYGKENEGVPIEEFTHILLETTKVVRLYTTTGMEFSPLQYEEALLAQAKIALSNLLETVVFDNNFCSGSDTVNIIVLQRYLDVKLGKMNNVF